MECLSAQRLSASEEETQSFAPSKTWRRPGAQRLSASEEETRAIPTRRRSTRSSCAQRLSASEEETRFSSESTPAIFSGAQRLSASEEETHPELPGAKLGVVVLNAFRHQRKKRVQKSKAASFSLRCSTPFGIRGRNAGRIRGGAKRPRVLNAFRHQRKKRQPVCSAAKAVRPGAQRLSASEEETLSNSNHTQDTFLVVLNAFRHQRKKRLMDVHKGSQVRSAQRLSASEEETLRVGVLRVQAVPSAQRLSASEEETRACRYPAQPRVQ